ncbi:SET domain-containing protein [Sulfurimonas sp.]|uniref:SET domain-containing protein n=1 Tax=Sulfurimonas sp. TaxID=2022749 RepID=UPI0035647535
MDNDLTKWIEDNRGFIHPDIYIATKNIDGVNYRSVYCKNSIEIPKDTRLTKIPYKLIISDKLFDNIPNIDKCSDYIKDENSNFKLIMVLLYETIKGEDSFYYPYIKTLPKYNTFKNHPVCIHYKDSEAFKSLELLSVKFTELVESKSKELKRFIDLILLCQKKHKIFSKNISVEDLKKMITWSYLIKITRTWGNKLIPFNDSFNHNNNSNIFLKTIEDDEKYYGFKSDRQFLKKHEYEYEIFVNYGHFDMMTTQAEYDFIAPSKVNYLRVPLTFASKDSFEKLKIEEINKCDFNPRRILLSNAGPSKNLSAIMRILSLEKEEYEEVIKKDDENKYQAVINNNNELRSTTMLLKVILALKKNMYTLDIMNRSYMLLNTFEAKKSLSPSDIIIKNICLVKAREYKLVDDSLNWLSNRLSKLIKEQKLL